MANHLRRQIRDAAAGYLTGLTTTGMHIATGRVYPVQDSELPALRVYTNEQAVEQETINANPVEGSVLQLVVEAIAKATSGTDDILDGIAKEVQVALAAQQTLAGVKNVLLRSIEPDRYGEGEQELGILRLTFEVAFKSAQNAPDVAV